MASEARVHYRCCGIAAAICHTHLNHGIDCTHCFSTEECKFDQSIQISWIVMKGIMISAKTVHLITLLSISPFLFSWRANSMPSHAVFSRRYSKNQIEIREVQLTSKSSNHQDDDYQGYYKYRHSYPICMAHKEMIEASLPDSSISSATSMAPEEENTSLWPPWPFSLLTRRRRINSSTISSKSGISISNQSGIGLFFAYLREKGKVSFHQISMMGSALSFHLPPAGPPIILLALLPSIPTMTVIDPATNLPKSVSKSMLQRLHSLSRKFALASLGVTVLSWAEYEVRKKKRLTPLPLVHRDIRNTILPPFLPEQSEDIFEMSSTNFEQEEQHVMEKMNTSDFFQDGKIDFPNLTKNLSNVYKTHNPDTMLNSWRKIRALKQRDEYELKRRKILDELLVLQQLKKERNRRWEAKKKSILENINNGIGGINNNSANNGKKQVSEKPLGYALVTGASQGIGRALAVELARWEIPLILVARDLDKLNNLAQEIRAAYGVQCCVIQADLSIPHVAKKIYETTKKAGMNVDILVNNAGVCTVGDMIDSSEENLNQMINVNVGSATTLGYLYGQDMKKQRRGRILFVSSVVGTAPGGPGVATYSATKSYEKSLALSMGIEMEKYGVGVTCLMPGAVKGTSFACRSNAEEAICWKFPMYPMTAQDVASRGVNALLAGNSEVIPGWHNRLFLRVLSPLLPQRTTTKLVGFSFSPLKLGLPWAQEERSETDNTNSESWFLRSPPPILQLLEDKSQISSDELKKDNDVESSIGNDNQEILFRHIFVQQTRKQRPIMD